MSHHSHGEAQTSHANLLLEYLEEITDDELKKFKFNLIHLSYETYQRIPRGQLEILDRTELAEKMIGFYSEDGALNVMLEVLKKMNLNNLAQRLNEDRKKRHPPPCVPFVDQHRTAIVQRVSLTDPILDDLYDHIGGEKYSYIRAASTSQERMRRLYEVLNTDRLKELFFDALKKNESYLVRDLLGL